MRVACTPSAWRAPFRGRQRLPVAVLRLLAVAPRVSQRQEQQQRTQALAQLPRGRSSPARRRRHHRGRSRLLPGARALRPPCAPLLRARRRRRLSPRQGAPEGRGVCATCEGTGAGLLWRWGTRLGVGVQSANSVDRLVNDLEGGGVHVVSAGMVTLLPDSLDSALRCALPPASVLG